MLYLRAMLSLLSYTKLRLNKSTEISQVTWHENWKICCTIGMKTLQPDLAIDYEKIYYNSNSKFSQFVKQLFIILSL
jgi:hypothetical protein